MSDRDCGNLGWCSFIEINGIPAPCRRHNPTRRHVVVQPARRQGKTLELARRRIRAVAEGGHINTTYRLSPEPALEAFRADLLLILGPV